MKTKKKTIIVSISILLVVCLIGIGVYFYWHPIFVVNEKLEYIKESYQGKNEEDICFVTDTSIQMHSIVPGKYIVAQTHLTSQFLKRGELPAKTFQYIVGFYDIHTLELVKTMDMTSAFRNLEKQNIYALGTLFPFTVQNGEDFLLAFLMRDYNDNEKKYFIFNIDTGEETVSAKSPFNWSKIIRSENLDKVDSLDGFHCVMYENWEGMVSLEVSCDNLPEAGAGIYDEFPELINYKGKPEYTANIFLSGYPSGDEILTMFDRN